MPLALLTLFTGLAISAVAIYYSVLGLAAIFAAAVIPIYIMGTILEISKLVTAWWLKANWARAPFGLKIYLTAAVVVLMFITSMGIFGFLSQAHSDQNLVSGDVQSKVALYDEQIKNERNNIDNARTLVKQLDDAVIGIQRGQGRELRSRDGTVRIENPAERALAVRRSQSRDRAGLSAQIEESQKAIQAIQEKRAPIAADLRKVEAEVGPIKYIAKLIYGDSADTNLLEQAVTWVIVIIVAVFDPLAVLLLMASQLSFQWAREQQGKSIASNGSTDVMEVPPLAITPVPAVDDQLHTDNEHIEYCYKCNTKLANAPGIGLFCPNKKCTVLDAVSGNEIQFKLMPLTTPVDINFDNLAYLNASRSFLDEPPASIISPLAVHMSQIASAPEVIEPNSSLTVAELDSIDEEIIEDSDPSDSVDMIEAKRLWKEANPADSLKHQRKLLESKIIVQLPWEVEPFLKKKILTYMEKVGKSQIKKEISEE